MLEVRELACERGERSLFSGLSLNLCAGETLELQGANGAGKSTFLRIIAGLAESYSGELNWQGQEIRRNRVDYHRQSFFLGHRSGVKPVLSVIENLRCLTELKNNYCENRAQRALQRLQLEGYATTPCYRLSAGQQKRVSLASLLTTDATLWILDEPFTALDSAGAEQLELMLAAHCEAGGIAVVASHQRLADRSGMQRLQL